MKFRYVVWGLLAATAWGQAAYRGTWTQRGTAISSSNTPPLTITTATLPNGTQNVAYSATLSVNNGVPPLTWSILTGSLPAGLTLTGSTGVISGTPTTLGTSSFTVLVTDSGGVTDSRALSITVNAPPAPLSITTSSLPNGTQGTAYSQTLTATGGTAPYTWSLSSGALPTGLSLSSAGVISGTPSSSGTFSFTVAVTDAAPTTVTKALSITVSGGASSCGPPNYNCSIYDTATHVLTTTVTLGNGWSGHAGGPVGANLVAVDSSLAHPTYGGNRILRLTDFNNVGRYARTFSGGGHNVFSTQQANNNYYVTFTSYGGANCMWEFDPAAYQGRKLWCGTSGSVCVGAGCAPSGGNYSAESVQFPRSGTPAYAFYGWYFPNSSTAAVLKRFIIDPVNAKFSVDAAWTTFDPDSATCLNGAVAASGGTYQNDFISGDDTRRVMAPGPQDTARYLVVQDNTSGCRWLDAWAMQVSNGWNTSTPKELTLNADAQSYYQRTIISASRTANVATVTFSATHNFLNDSKTHVNVIGCGNGLDVRAGTLTGTTSNSVSYQNTGTDGSWTGLSCTFLMGRGLHNGGLERSGGYVEIGWNASGNWGGLTQWVIGSDTLIACPAGQDCGGHTAPAWAKYYTPQWPGTTTRKIRSLPSYALSACTDMGFNPPIQTHFSANNTGGSSGAPDTFLESTFDAPPKSPAGPYEGEILGDMCATPKIVRFSHNFSDGSPSAGSLFGAAVTQVSSDGKYAIFTSNFEAFNDLDGVSMTGRGFGDGTGANTCVSTGDPSAGTQYCRSDVLLMELR